MARFPSARRRRSRKPSARRRCSRKPTIAVRKSRPGGWSRLRPKAEDRGVQVIGHAYALIFVVLFVAFWAGVIALGVWVALRLTGPRQSDSALSILNERFARGEIDQAEYETRKAALRKP